ncbi:hypothetical protein Tsubulata_041800, partial [Turnera subulata]
MVSVSKEKKKRGVEFAENIASKVFCLNLLVMRKQQKHFQLETVWENCLSVFIRG